ncbi:MAG: DUF1292 domain-containing protein [Lachnospiraceae bacterium]|nr:DUF1292 domain-containing protein [Lachnospiraceae bacterium]
MEKVNFTDPDTGDSLEFFVLEQTTIRGINYLLVTVDEEGDSDAFILREKEIEDDQNAIYEMVEDDKELSSIAKIFEELLEDVEIEA